MSGTLPAAVAGGWSKSLTDLDLRNNAFVGTVPQDWGRLSVLQVLRLSGNAGLVGCLPAVLQRLVNVSGADEDLFAATKLSRTGCP